MRVLYPGRIGIWSVGSCGKRETDVPGEKRSKQTHIWHQAGIEPGPGHNDGKRALSPLRQLCLAKLYLETFLVLEKFKQIPQN